MQTTTPNQSVFKFVEMELSQFQNNGKIIYLKADRLK
jgi:hypothetical protein